MLMGAARGSLMSDASIQTLIRADAAQILHNVVDELPDARERLAYVRSMTEQAATKVLNLVEAAQQDGELQPVELQPHPRVPLVPELRRLGDGAR